MSYGTLPNSSFKSKLNRFALELGLTQALGKESPVQYRSSVRRNGTVVMFYLGVATILFGAFVSSGHIAQGLILGAQPLFGLGLHLYGKRFHSTHWRRMANGHRAIVLVGGACTIAGAVMLVARVAA